MPEGMVGFPAGIVIFPTGNASLPAGIATFPAGIASIPTGMVSVPARITSLPAGKTTIPAGKDSIPAGKYRNQFRNSNLRILAGLGLRTWRKKRTAGTRDWPRPLFSRAPSARHICRKQIIEPASSVGAASGGRAEYAAPEGAGSFLEWHSTKRSPLTGLAARAFGLIKGLDRSKVGDMNQNSSIISRSVVVLLVSLAVIPLMAEQNPLTVGINRDNGHLVATDIWSKEYQAMQKDSGHAVDEKTDRLTGEIGRSHARFCFILGNTYDLNTNGTSLKGTMIVGYYNWPGYTDVNSFFNTFWVSASNGKIPLGGTYYGDSPYNPIHINDSVPIRQLQIEALAHENTKSGEVLWILKVCYRVELTVPVDFIPQIMIQCDMGTAHWGLTTYKSQQIASFLDRSNPPEEKWPSATDTFTVSKPKQNSSSHGETKPSVKADLPGVTLSIKKTGGFLVITFSPVVPNASLEEANPSSSPWIWQPATGITNILTNGWSVIPATEPHVYRLRLD